MDFEHTDISVGPAAVVEPTGDIVERNMDVFSTTTTSASSSVPEDDNTKPVSRFKASRLQHSGDR